MVRPRLPLIGIALVLVAVLASGSRLPARVGASVTPWEYRATKHEAERDHAQVMSRAVRDATFSFAPGTAVADQQAFMEAISTGIRPDAQRLVAVVDGLVTVQFAVEEKGALGHAGPRGDRFALLLDLGLIRRELGARGLRQVAMHELGHVVDFALVPDGLRAPLVSQIPTGYQCPPGSRISACAPREERFAETFAKWATGDLGNGLYAGYAVMPPVVPFDTWGAPLSKLAAVWDVGT